MSATGVSPSVGNAHCSSDFCHSSAVRSLFQPDKPATDAWVEPASSDYGERVFPLCAEHMAEYVAAAAGE